MIQKLHTVLKSWEASLMNFKKLDQWNQTEDFSVLGYFIKHNENKELSCYIRNCRDYALKENTDPQEMLRLVHLVLNHLPEHSDKAICLFTHRRSIGQKERFEYTTKALFKEKLRFKNNQNLRNVDITIEDGPTSRKVRRIVEKRMCQAYYKQHRETFREETNRSRHHMKRAVSYELYNMGQIENVYQTGRTLSTHWKRMFDPVTNSVVFKKKTEYQTLEEAEKAIVEWHTKHPYDDTPMRAYKCAYCHKYHIGHDSELLNELIN